MEFRETLLAAQRNQQQNSSKNVYYKARFDPPKKEQKSKDKLSANIQKFLAKKEEEERQKKLEAKKKCDELLAMRDPKAIRKIQKSLKVIKSANKSVIEDAIDREHTAVTRDGPVQPDQDDYGYESQEAAALYQKMMEKYSKIKEEPKFPTGGSKVTKDLEGTKQRVKQALLQEDEPVPHKRRRRTEHEADREPSPPPKEEKKPDKPKVRKPMPPPLDFNQLLKIAEQKKSEPLDVVPKKEKTSNEPERLMTKKQKKEYEEEMARRMRRQERLDRENSGGKKATAAPVESKTHERPPDKKPESSGGFARIPKIGEKINKSSPIPKTSNKDKIQSEMEKIERLQKEKARLDKERLEKDRERLDLERLEKLKAEREKIEKDIERLNRDRERLEKTKMKLESSKVDKPKVKIDMKNQNTYRIDKSNDKKVSDNRSINGKTTNGHSKPSTSNHNKIPKKQDFKTEQIRSKDGKIMPSSNSKQKPNSTFDFDKHIDSLKKPAIDPKKKMLMEEKRKMMQKRRALNSESEYDSEMDDFIDDGDEGMDYSTHIKEIFGYDKSRYRDVDDDDDPTMESSFSRQMREEYVSKKIGIMEDLEDIRLERKMNERKKKKRRLSDDD